jgi:hypothetical protein
MSTVPAETPVLDLLATMTAASVEQSELDARSLMMVRLAALVAVDAPPVSYLMNLAVAGDVGVGAEDVGGRQDRPRTGHRGRRRRGGARGSGTRGRGGRGRRLLGRGFAFTEGGEGSDPRHPG